MKIIDRRSIIIKKKIIAAAAIVVMLILTAVLIMINYPVSTENQQSTESMAVSDVQQNSEQSAEFDFVCTDRLCGCPETKRRTTPESVEVVFFDIGTIIKEYVSEKETVSEEDRFGEVSEKEINGMLVSLKGDGGKVLLASRSDNGFKYTIRINSSDNGISTEEMTDYIISTR